MTGQAVFFIPHQDDEFLTQGPYIRQHVEAGRDVVVVSMNNGANSSVRDALTRDGIYINPASFSKARDRELIDCLTRLGVDRQRIFFENLEDGGDYTTANVRGIFAKHFQVWGESSYKTHSWMDAHRDHHILGRVMQGMVEEGKVPGGDVRFSRSFRYTDAPIPQGGSEATCAADAAFFRNAGAAYAVERTGITALASAFDMASGPRYGIGLRSVGPEWFEEVATKRTTTVHKDASFYTSAQRTSANTWLRNNGQQAFL